MRLLFTGACAFVAAGCTLSSSTTSSGGDAADAADARPFDAAEFAADSAANAAIDAAPPSMAALKIDGLTPAFTPDVHDYAIRCAAGQNTVRVTATASADTTLAIVKPSPAALVSDTATDATLVEDDLLEVRASTASGSTSYFVRCLPHDFPAMTASRTGSPAPGYYLLANLVVGTGESGFVMALDTNGTPVWYRRTGVGGGYVTVRNANEIIYSPVLGPTFGVDPGGHWTVLDLTTGVATSLAAAGAATDHHEIVPLAGGRFLVQSYPRVSGVDLTSRGIATTDIADCRIQELAADGAVAWQWQASEHFDVAKESVFLEQDVVDALPIVDGFHCNSIDVFPSGDLLVSFRHMDAIARIARATGRVTWKLGGVPSNKDGAQLFTLVGDAAGGFHRQHDARALSESEISLFDNHTPAAGPARGMHLAIDEHAATATVTWSYSGPTGSNAMGSVRRQPGGGHVFGWGLIGGSPTIAATELDASDNKIFEAAFTGASRPYRVVKVDDTQLDIALLRATAGR